MQARRPSAFAPLAIVLPHPPLPRRRSSLLSASSSSPHTPRSCASPTCPSLFFTTAANRKSTDSWNSSNQDELEWEWKPEQTLLLSRTLDALPAHLLTPFNGPVPPSNLLDKIARGVSHAKGPDDWPHSIRATRAKLVEISRVRAKEAAQDDRSKTITEEDDDAYFGGDVLQQTTNIDSRRPLYRQSSMDFMNTAKPDLKDNDNINRLSNRLQRTDRLISNPSYHPYSRPSLHRSPSSSSRPDSFPPSLCLSPSTPSSTTLNTSFSSVPSRIPRRPTSSLSNSSDPYLLPSFPSMAEDPRVQRVRRTDSFCGSPYNGNVSSPKGMKHNLKRAPSFGAVAHDTENDGRLPSYPSSDEEEKVRSKKAKKQRTKIVSPAPTSPPSSPIIISPMPPTTKSRLKSKAPSSCVESMSLSSKSGSGSSTSSSSKTVSTAATTVSSRSSTSKPKANLQRNPIILGAELPRPQTPIKTPSRTRASTRTHPTIASPTTPAQAPTPTVGPTTPTAHPTKTLRRVRGTSFARAPARRISFGSLVAPAEEVNPGAQRETGVLGSAFQLI